METPLIYAIAAAPLGYLGAALIAHSTGIHGAVAASRAAAWTAVAAVVVAIVRLVGFGADSTAVLGVSGWGLQLRVDALSVTLLAVVCGVGAVVLRFSRRYLDGDPAHATFIRDLCLTLAGVSTFVLAGNLGQLLVAWVATSVALHRLLMFFPRRPRAVLAARKKFIVARLSDTCLLIAAAALVAAFGTPDIAEISAAARSGGAAAGVAVHVAAIALAIAACLKSAQFPAHGWLLDVMETPTPVSALLHAGLVNAGGFVVLRFADVMILSEVAMALLVAVGAATALLGAAVMTTQTRVKTALAYSTIGQMGFMLLQCGLGAFSAAALHLVAHSLYKAHAFLSSGSHVARKRDGHRVHRGGFGPLFLGIAMASIVFVAVGGLLGFSAADEPGVMVLGAAAAIGLGYLLAKSAHRLAAAAATAGLVAVLSTVYFVLQLGAQRVFGAVVPLQTPLSTLDIVLGAGTVVGFVALAVLQWSVSSDQRRLAPLYVALKNGLYLNAAFDRLVTTMAASQSRSR
jgi:NAD(P)H-quinone oxidoreductase subunit 5